MIQQSKNGMISIKKDHHSGYYTQVQVAIGLSGVNYCDLLYSKVDFDNKYFEKLIVNLNQFCKNFRLLGILL